MCVCVCTCMREGRENTPQKPEEGIRFSGGEVSGGEVAQEAVSCLTLSAGKQTCILYKNSLQLLLGSKGMGWGTSSPRTLGLKAWVVF